MKTFLPKDPGPARNWRLIDADGQPVGRLAVKIANIIRGKDKPTFSKQVDTGDFVVVINADKVKFTGDKETKKIYSFYSGYRSGLKNFSAEKLRIKHPEMILKLAVRGMLPKNNLNRQIISKLKVYAGNSHPHIAQKPVECK